ncbi:MAG: hypothetical protein OEZ65_15000 [Gemmatimonadota bacterium]|nr:hypothetical protein [Gemmatimonadota bacterium]
MEELIFFGVFILFSILDGVARSRKKKAGAQVEEPGASVPLPREWGRTIEEDDDEIIGTYDDDVRDEVAVATRSGPPEGSEGLVLGTLWEELERLSRGEVGRPQAPARPRPAPSREPVFVPEEPRVRSTERVITPEVVDSRALEALHAGHAIHKTHPRMGTPVASRLSALDTPEDHRPRRSRAAGSLREVLRGGRMGLRQAVLLGEVLGPPVGLRGEGDGDGRLPLG